MGGVENKTTVRPMFLGVVVIGLIVLFLGFTQEYNPGRGSDNRIPMTKETMGMIEAAYGAYLQEHTLTEKTTPKDLMPYMNYVQADSITKFLEPVFTTGEMANCSENVCLKLHNGGLLYLVPESFKEDSYYKISPDYAAIDFYFDPAPMENTGVIKLGLVFHDGKVWIEDCSNGVVPEWLKSECPLD